MMVTVETALKAVRERGFVTFAPESAATAEDFASRLGEILCRTEVRLNPVASTYLCRPGAIPPHTDHPDVRYILWYCRVPDVCGNRLVDAKSVLESLPQPERGELERLRFQCPPLHGGAALSEHTLWDPVRQRFFFANWLVHKDEVDLARKGESMFTSPGPHQFRVVLQQGEALLIDNHRMLHFRDALEPTSARWLLRLWISDRNVHL